MDPRKAELLRQIEALIGSANAAALTHYAKLLKACGVRTTGSGGRCGVWGQ